MEPFPEAAAPTDCRKGQGGVAGDKQEGLCDRTFCGEMYSVTRRLSNVSHLESGVWKATVHEMNRCKTARDGEGFEDNGFWGW